MPTMKKDDNLEYKAFGTQVADDKAFANPTQAAQPQTLLYNASRHAQFFSCLNDTRIEPGYFLSFVANSEEVTRGNEDTIGVSIPPDRVLGDAAANYWNKKFLLTPLGEIQMQDVESIETVKLKHIMLNGQVILFNNNNPLHQGKEAFLHPAKVGSKKIKQPVINPDFDPNLNYLPRSHRSDWVAVCLFGKVWVYSQEGISIGDYVTSNKDGLAVSCSKHEGYRVFEVNDKAVRILFR